MPALQTQGVFYWAKIYMQWFRTWTDILDDHKLAQLSDYEFRIFQFLLACASEENSHTGLIARNMSAISRRIRRRKDHLMSAIETFQKLGLVSMNGDEAITITNWSKRQFKSDNVYERVKKHRKVSEYRNVSKALHETLPDTDTDTDTDKQIHKKKIKRSGVVFQIPTYEEAKEYCVKRGNSIDAEAFIAHYNSNGWMVGKNKMKDWRATIVTWEKRNYGKAESNVRGDTRSVYDKNVDEEAERINREWRAAKAKEAARVRAKDDAKGDSPEA